MAQALQGISDDDLLVAARTVYGEARGEGQPGMEAVAWVIRNRYETALNFEASHPDKPEWWGDTIGGICQKPYQFSCWNKNDPNVQLIQDITLADPIFTECYSAVCDVMDGMIEDPTSGATSYKTTALPWPSAWGAEVDPVAVIGHQSFYRL